ncbi:MAG TPA: hypothetical protein VF549_07735 [Solirubrobacteraceae bacterium]|jgi:hypothetical protein
MLDSDERTENHEDEREQWEEPRLDVTSLKAAMSTGLGTGTDGPNNYS